MARKTDIHCFKESRGKASITWCNKSIIGTSDKITTERAETTCKACEKALSIKEHGRYGSNG